jgi:hypothetical protein
LDKLVEENDDESGTEETPTDESEMGKWAETGGGTVEIVGEGLLLDLGQRSLTGP